MNKDKFGDISEELKNLSLENYPKTKLIKKKNNKKKRRHATR